MNNLKTRFVYSARRSRLSNCRRIVVVAALVLSVEPIVQGQGAAKTGRGTKRVPFVAFVCEHGSAKSVISAAHFNKLASDRNLKVRAISRGTNPDKEVAAKAVEGLRADGLAVSRVKPKRLSTADVSRGLRVVAFCELPQAFSKNGRVEHWSNLPAVSEDYSKARDAIVERVRHLLDELGSAK